MVEQKCRLCTFLTIIVNVHGSTIESLHLVKSFLPALWIQITSSIFNLCLIGLFPKGTISQDGVSHSQAQILPVIFLRSAMRRRRRFLAKTENEMLDQYRKGLVHAAHREEMIESSGQFALDPRSGFILICLGQKLYVDQQISEGGRKFKHQICIQWL